MRVLMVFLSRFALYLAIFCFSNSAFSQEQENDRAGFTFGFAVGGDGFLPKASYHGVVAKPAFEVQGGYLFSNGLEISVGLDLSHYQYITEPYIIKETSTSSTNGTVTVEKLVIYHSRSLLFGLPIKIGYHVNFSNWSFVPQVGVIYPCYGSTRYYYEYIESGTNGYEKNSSGFAGFSMFVTGSIGLARNFDRAQLILSVSSNNLLFVRGYGTSRNDRFRSAGVNLGYHYSF